MLFSLQLMYILLKIKKYKSCKYIWFCSIIQFRGHFAQKILRRCNIMKKNDIEARARDIESKVRELYMEYGHYDVTVSVNRKTTEGFTKTICGKRNADVSILFYPNKKVECTFNTEKPELRGDFFNLQADLAEWLNENGYSKCAGDYIGNIYFFQLRF